MTNRSTKKLGGRGIVLVGVLKSRRDLAILLEEKWYRIPLAWLPKRKFQYLAFYQPALFGRQGKRIRYYAQVLDFRRLKRKELLPEEARHPGAQDDYFLVRVGKILKLHRPIKNIIPRRVTFGFTTLRRLLNSKNILQLYGVIPTEQIVGQGLRRAGIKAAAQYHVSCRRRYCIDFAVFCARGAIAIECDNKKAHSGRRQKEKDKIKNADLRRCGWVVIRLPEEDIIRNLDGCIAKVRTIIRKLGGLGSADF